MNEFIIEIARKKIRITALYESALEHCRAYLSQGEPDFSVTVSPEDIAFEREKSRREDALEGIPPREYSDAYLETIAVQRKIAEKLFAYDTLLFHGSVIAVDGKAYLFTAKSGTGKSTHTRLWRELLGERAVMVNDDKPFLRIADSGVLVYGSPWNGKHRLGTNTCVPLKAICILERGEENRIQRIEPQEAVVMLLQQSNRPLTPLGMPKYLDLVDALSQRVGFYRMACNMDPEAARMAYETMAGEN